MPAILRELKGAGKLHLDAMTCTGKTLGENMEKPVEVDREVIRAYDKPMKEKAGFAVLSGNLFDGAVMKISVIDKAFRDRFLSDPDQPNVFEGKAIVFEGPEDYHDRIEDPALGVDEHCILVIRNCGPVGYPGSAEVVNMQPPASMLKQGVDALPTMGDGRQSGTSGSPSILNISPEAVVGGGLALLQTGDKVRIDLNTRKVDVLIPEAELAARRKAWTAPELENQTPWEEIYRSMVGQMYTGACLEPATLYLNIVEERGESRTATNPMPGRLAGKTAFITAAAQGIGRATALAYAQEGARVIATDLNEAKLAGARRRHHDAAASTCTDAAAIAAAIASAGPLDILFNCAGFVHQGTDPGRARTRTGSSPSRSTSRSMCHTIRAALPAMVERGGGSIVNMASSAASSVKGAPNRVRLRHHQGRGDRPDQVGRRRLRQARRPLQRHLPRHGRDARAWSTRIAANARSGRRARRGARQPSSRRQAMGRLGTPEEIAALAVYLGSDESRFVTGQAIVIDGGWTL